MNHLIMPTPIRTIRIIYMRTTLSGTVQSPIHTRIATSRSPTSIRTTPMCTTGTITNDFARPTDVPFGQRLKSGNAKANIAPITKLANARP